MTDVDLDLQIIVHAAMPKGPRHTENSGEVINWAKFGHFQSY